MVESSAHSEGDSGVGEGADAQRLIVVTTPRRRKTTRSLEAPLADAGITLERWAYRRFFGAEVLPRAAFILSDFDRVHPWHLELAGRFRDRLVDGGATVLNDPRRFVPRAALLRKLHREGINGFSCWMPAEGEWPERYPVFLRTICAHRGVASDLLHGRDDAEAALAGAISAGHVVSDLVFVEYCAEHDPDSGVFRKHACYGINGTMIRALTVSDTSWVAKQGSVGAASPENYESDLAEHHDYPHRDLMRQVMDLAGLEYGRIDFGLVGGRPQIYEVNSCPFIGWAREHPSEMRLEADRLVKAQMVSALAGIAARCPSGEIDVSDLLPLGQGRTADAVQP